jgi:hypothetical protein
MLGHFVTVEALFKVMAKNVGWMTEYFTKAVAGCMGRTRIAPIKISASNPTLPIAENKSFLVSLSSGDKCKN